MAMDSSHHQEVGSQTLESMLASTKPEQEKKARPAEQSLKCPRCDSSNTKFCYYNNYSLSQPRYFCKSCRRYWTKGGTLRNVPVGGGCRKAKRSSSSSSSRRNHDHPITSLPNPAPIPSYTYASNIPTPRQLGLDDHHGFLPIGDCGLIDALRGGILEIPRFQNLYSCGNINGDGDGNGLECGMGMGIGVLNEEMGMMGFEEFGSGGGAAATTSSAAVKQEMCSNSSGGGFPRQNFGGDGSLDSTRISSWINGIGSSAWHGLLNSPLM